MLFPVIGFGDPQSKVRVNFGGQPFRYDIDAHEWKNEQVMGLLNPRITAALSRRVIQRARERESQVSRESEDL